MQEQGLVVVNDNFLGKISRFWKKLFFNKKVENIYNESDFENIQYIKRNTEYIQPEIIDARTAFRKYVTNNNKDISEKILSYVMQQIEINKEKINKIIEINEDNIVFEDIVLMLEMEKSNITKFKHKNKKTGCYQVPVGVVGVKCDNAKDCIYNMIKSISTRNSIIILNENYNKYSTESLLLLILKECLKNFYIDDNLIQMFEDGKIDETKLDRILEVNCKRDYDKIHNSIYLYQENDEYEEVINSEINKIKEDKMLNSYDVKVIKGNFYDVIDFLNKNKPFAVCMYTKNPQITYKYINWVNSPNLLVNCSVNNCKKKYNFQNDYFNLKNVCHKDIF